nr:MAG TPA: GDSL-like Lipase/Acylhydrolase family protein/Beta fold, peptidoglycan hydrolase, HYDROLASE [Caudoviricetes sp.]
MAATVWQYDYGMKLRLQGLQLPAAVEIHFSVQETRGEAITRVGTTQDGVTDVTIPDSLLENDDATRNYLVYAFVYLTDETSGQTEYKVTIPVNSRPRPNGRNKPEDQELFRQAIDAVNAAASRAETAGTTAQSWAVGGTGTRDKEDTDNAKYYAQQAKKAVDDAAEAFKGSTEQIETNKTDITALKEDLNAISDERNFIPIKLSFSDNVGKYITTNGTISTNKFFSISDLIPIESEKKKMRITFKKANPSIARVAFLKKNVLSNDNVISFFVNGDSGTFDVEIPKGTKYVVVNSDTDERGLTENGYPKARFFPSSANVDELAKSVNGLNAKVGEISEKLVDSIVETGIEPIYEKYLGKYVTPNGGISSNVYYHTSNPIKIDEMVDRIKVEVDTGNKYISRIVFLSSDSLTVSNMIWFSVDTTKPVAEYEVPNDAKYFCVAKDVDESGNAHDGYPHVITVATKKSEISDLRDEIDGIEKSNRKPALNIGSKIYAVVGDTLQIFKKSIVDSLGIPYVMKIESAKGRAYPRYWEYTPNADDVGSSEIKFSLLNVDGSAIDERIVSLITVNASNTSKNVLNIGDSTMANGEIPIELSRRIKGTNGVATAPTALALSNIDVVGRIKNGDKTVGWEGTGGWTYQSYTSQGSRAVRFQVANAQSITVKDLIRIGATNSYGYYQFEVTEVNVTNGTGNIRAVFSYTTPYSSNFLNEVSASGNLTNANNSVVGSYLSFTEEFYQPFWNSTANQFDIKTYVKDYCGNKVDYIFILLGINSLYGTKPFTSVDSVLDSCKNLLRKIHADLPNTKILLSTNHLISQNGGLGFNYNAQTYFGQYDVTVINHLIFAMNKAYYTLETDTEFMQYVEVINTHAQFDADNAFPITTKNVNTRSGETESVGTNGVHPTNNGYWQIADAEFRALLAN